MGRLFIIMEIIFLLLTTVAKRLTTSMCVLFWMVQLCGYVAGLWFAKLKSQLLDFYPGPWTSYVISLFAYL